MKPQLSGKEDVGQFSDEFTREKAEDKKVDPPTSKNAANYFRNYSFVAPEWRSSPVEEVQLDDLPAPTSRLVQRFVPKKDFNIIEENIYNPVIVDSDEDDEQIPNEKEQRSKVLSNDSSGISSGVLLSGNESSLSNDEVEPPVELDMDPIEPESVDEDVYFENIPVENNISHQIVQFPNENDLVDLSSQADHSHEDVESQSVTKDITDCQEIIDIGQWGSVIGKYRNGEIVSTKNRKKRQSESETSLEPELKKKRGRPSKVPKAADVPVFLTKPKQEPTSAPLLSVVRKPGRSRNNVKKDLESEENVIQIRTQVRSQKVAERVNDEIMVPIETVEVRRAEGCLQESNKLVVKPSSEKVLKAPSKGRHRKTPENVDIVEKQSFNVQPPSKKPQDGILVASRYPKRSKIEAQPTFKTEKVDRSVINLKILVSSKPRAVKAKLEKEVSEPVVKVTTKGKRGRKKKTEETIPVEVNRVNIAAPSSIHIRCSYLPQVPEYQPSFFEYQQIKLQKLLRDQTN